MSDIEGKATRVGASERGQRTSFKRCKFQIRVLIPPDAATERRRYSAENLVSNAGPRIPTA
jgi:hypothetical protein